MASRSANPISTVPVSLFCGLPGRLGCGRAPGHYDRVWGDGRQLLRHPPADDVVGLGEAEVELGVAT